MAEGGAQMEGLKTDTPTSTHVGLIMLMLVWLHA